jgi:hypothetical protein
VELLCKIYEANKKNRKGKEEKKRKRVKGPGEPFWPSREKSPRPNLPPPEMVSSLSPPR